MSDVNPLDSVRFDVTKFVVITGWLLTLLVCGGLVLTYIILLIIRPEEPPASLKDQSTLAIGFLFGSCVSLIKDFIQQK